MEMSNYRMMMERRYLTSMKTITATELKPILEEQKGNTDVAFIDIRLPWEFSRMHIPGFINIPYDELEKRADEIEDKTSVYLLCQIGDNSGAMARKLEEKGVGVECTNIRGGFMAWADAGFVIDASDKEGNLTLSKMRDTINALLRKME